MRIKSGRIREAAADAPGEPTPPTAWSGSFASLRDLEVLHAVIEARQATAAGARLGISQPAVSRTIAQLEARSGRTLFRREGAQLAPTADALALYEETKPIFQTLERLRDFQWSARAAAPLRLAAPPTVAFCLLEPLLAEFVRRNGVRVALEIATTPAVFELVADGRADLAIADVVNPTSSLQRLTIARTAVMAALPEAHRLAKAETVQVGDLHGEAMVLLVKRNPARSLIDRLCTKAGVKPQVVIETSNALSAVRLVADGAGITLVNPFPVSLAPMPGIVYRPFAPEIAYETAFHFAPDAPLSSDASRFVEFVRGKLAEKGRT